MSQKKTDTSWFCFCMCTSTVSNTHPSAMGSYALRGQPTPNKQCPPPPPPRAPRALSKSPSSWDITHHRAPHLPPSHQNPSACHMSATCVYLFHTCMPITLGLHLMLADPPTCHCFLQAELIGHPLSLEADIPKSAPITGHVADIQRPAQPLNLVAVRDGEPGYGMQGAATEKRANDGVEWTCGRVQRWWGLGVPPKTCC
jgi:hypothetical protein